MEFQESEIIILNELLSLVLLNGSGVFEIYPDFDNLFYSFLACLAVVPLCLSFLNSIP